jgi:hypothetical protein
MDPGGTWTGRPGVPAVLDLSEISRTQKPLLTFCSLSQQTAFRPVAKGAPAAAFASCGHVVMLTQDGTGPTAAVSKASKMRGCAEVARPMPKC